ncbi:hypothetical protein [Streptomyces sp. A1-5]|nr:hypothetical protein [Streptomyces sp. A1-5]
MTYDEEQFDQLLVAVALAQRIPGFLVDAVVVVDLIGGSDEG